jgi:hypothetical protein
MIYDALGTGEVGKVPLGVDVEALARSARTFAESWKAGWSGTSTHQRHTTQPVREQPTTAQPAPPAPKPKDWLSYSWQHNLRDGLISLFTGAGLGAVLYYVAKVAIEQGTLADVETVSHVNGLARIAGLIWLLALIPVLKGLAQIIYAGIFAQSIDRLSEKFIPQSNRVVTAPQSEPELPVREYVSFGEAPPSVTEGTTEIFQAEPARRATSE